MTNQTYADIEINRLLEEKHRALFENDELQKEIKELKKRLVEAKEVIKSYVPQNALGRDPYTGHYYRDELIYHINNAIGKSDG